MLTSDPELAICKAKLTDFTMRGKFQCLFSVYKNNNFQHTKVHKKR